MHILIQIIFRWLDFFFNFFVVESFCQLSPISNSIFCWLCVCVSFCCCRLRYDDDDYVAAVVVVDYDGFLYVD